MITKLIFLCILEFLFSHAYQLKYANYDVDLNDVEESKNIGF